MRNQYLVLLLYCLCCFSCKETETDLLIEELNELWSGAYHGSQICVTIQPGMPVKEDTLSNVTYTIHGFSRDAEHSFIHVDLDRNGQVLEGYMAYDHLFEEESVDLVKIIEHNYYSIKLFRDPVELRTYSNRNLIPYGGSDLTCNGVFTK